MRTIEFILSGKNAVSGRHFIKEKENILVVHCNPEYNIPLILAFYEDDQQLTTRTISPDDFNMGIPVHGRATHFTIAIYMISRNKKRFTLPVKVDLV